MRFSNRTPCHIAHGIQSILIELPRIPGANPPKVRKRYMIPKLLPIRTLIKLCNPDTVFVCRNLLCHNIHCDLT